MSAEHKLNGITAIASVYHYRIDHLIQTVYLPDYQQQFQNVAGVRSDGVELELNGKFRRFETGSSLALQDAGGPAGRLANSARVLAKARAAVPLLSNRLTLSSHLQYISTRLTYERAMVHPVTLADVTVTWQPKDYPWRLQFGVRNLFNCLYQDPVALAVDALPADGRSVFLKLSWRFGG